MTKSLKHFFFFILVILMVKNLELCPTETIKYESFDILDEQIMQWKSQEGNIFYHIVQEEPGKLKLFYYRIEDQSQSLKPILSVSKTHHIDVNEWQQIIGVSKKGSCVVVKQGNFSNVYYTHGTEYFTQKQQFVSWFIDFADEFTVIPSEDCFMVRIQYITKGVKSSKSFIDSIQNLGTKPPEGSLFDSTLNYAIDNYSNFYLLNRENWEYKSQSVPEIKSKPLYVQFSVSFQTLTILSKDQNGNVAILVWSPYEPQKKYLKIIPSDKITGELRWIIHQEAEIYIMLMDDTKLISLSFVNSQISLTKPDTEGNTIYSKDVIPFVNKLNDQTIFGKQSHVSMSGRKVFVHNNGKIHYIQIVNLAQLYYLGSQPSDIEKVAENYQNQHSTNKFDSIVSMISPGGFTFCSPFFFDLNPFMMDIDESEFIRPTLQENGEYMYCGYSCLKCSSGGKCLECRAGYVLDETKQVCLFCGGCMSCNALDPSVCYECFYPQVYDKTQFKCVDFSCNFKNCIQCDQESKCKECESGYSVIGDVCTKCKVEGCLSCKSDPQICDEQAKCMNGMIPFTYSNKTKVCISCATGCQTCKQEDISACTNCTLGFYLADDEAGIKRCLSCIQNCKYCQNSTMCLKCNPGYQPSSDLKRCNVVCSQNCATCDASDPSKCLTCVVGTVLDPRKQTCIENVQECNQQKSCKACPLNLIYYYGYCNSCIGGDQFCVCHSLAINQCIRCKAGYYIKDGTCAKCDQGCAECFVAGSCSRCADGYFLLTQKNGPTGKCLKCDQECKTCRGSALTCLTCQNGFKRQGNRCIGKNKVILRLVLAIPLSNLPEVIEKVIDWILEKVNSNLPTPSIKRNQLILRSAKSGSSMLDFVISAGTIQVANLMAEGLINAIMEGPTVDGVMLTGSVSTETQLVIKNCNQMLNATTCKTCQTDFALHHNKCTKTVPNCRLYDKMGNCIKCSETFVLFKNKCLATSTIQNCKQLSTLKKTCFKVNGRCMFTIGFDYTRC